MKDTAHILMMAATLLAVTAAHAEVMVKDAWVRATVPQQQANGVFMQLNSSKDTKLVSANSPLTPSVEVHEMAMQDNVIRMRQVPGVDLPEGKTVELKSGGYHVMLMNLRQQVKVGDTVTLTLVFESSDGKRETQVVQAQVRAFNNVARPMEYGDHKH
jgi:copper(I)-binding protein